MLALLLPALALAVEVERYPMQATLDPGDCAACDPGGAVRVALPAELRSRGDPSDGSDLAVLDAEGKPIRFAVARGSGEGREWGLTVTPNLQTGRYTVDQTSRPLDGMKLDLPHRNTVVDVTVWRVGEDQPLAGPTRLWRYEDRGEDMIEFPATSGPFIVQVEPLVGAWWPWRELDLNGWIWEGPRAGPLRIELPVASRRLDEDNLAVYSVPLPRALPVRAFEIAPKDRIYQRRVVTAGGPADEPTAYWAEGGQVQRVEFGGAHLDLNRVEMQAPPPSRELIFGVDAAGQPPLDIPTVTVELVGEELILFQPGPGPWRLLAGAPAGTTTPSDIQVALPELFREARGRVEPTDVGPNPQWRPPEQRAELSLPGQPADLRRQRWSRPIEGPDDLVRLQIGAEVLEAARSDLGDLRVVDSAGDQVPFVLRRRAEQDDWGSLPMQREERGRQTLLRLQNPHPALPVSLLCLSTTAPTFSRQVSVLRVAATELVPMRTTQWQAADRPGQLCLSLNEAMGEEIVVRIDNDDDPPLPITDARATGPRWELLCWLPPGGARLIYGDPRALRPDYDLSMLTSELAMRVEAEASLGPAEELSAPPLSTLDRMLLYAGLAALMGGMAWLVVALLRGVPEAAPESEASPT